MLCSGSNSRVTVRSADSLARTSRWLIAHSDLPPTEAEPGPRTWETSNLLHLGQALTLTAQLREETRGGHVRSDFPERSEAWRGRLHTRRQEDGTLEVWFAEVPAQEAVEAAQARADEHQSTDPTPEQKEHPR